ncbi:hypothetical protein SEA_GODONK_235 [Gordonia phage GodonK]|nr:hypothetical protein HOV33_gp009 [Gordonia phage GodonK]YP_009821588.1 hypothetical protein HOV33_gp133 [Gordonia phage GodonK]QBZ72628.1 hypothetical protein SEA_GODONK_9 [Gordonia phage GodonK]QBZ72823.1 hypothetical protein SEA_GODONK_235 [Gordonia phage GodonK]
MGNRRHRMARSAGQAFALGTSFTYGLTDELSQHKPRKPRAKTSMYRQAKKVMPF